jgi:hypothetical protein
MFNGARAGKSEVHSLENLFQDQERQREVRDVLQQSLVLVRLSGTLTRGASWT